MKSFFAVKLFSNKINFYKLILISTILCNCILANANAVPSRNLTVFAEPQMASVITKIARSFSQKNNAIISVNFSSAYDLINDIDQGEPANVFISAHPQIIENLRQKGLVDVYNIAYIATDKLILCTAKNNNNFPLELLKKNISFEESLKILDNYKLGVILDHDGVSAGNYGRKIIQNLSLTNLKIFNKLPEDKSSLIRDIEMNKDAYGILFQSNLTKKTNLRKLSIQNDKNIFYQAFVIAGENMDIAREFLNYLKSKDAKNILSDNGYIVDL